MGDPRSLAIVIPAYNEEAAISDIVRRCLDAREPIRRETGLERVDVIVVDDGSRDRTREIAAGFPAARLMVHPGNRGYGAALATGFASSDADLLAFLDADGTCDPLAFVELHRALVQRGADMSVGNRMGEGSRMPAVRRIGNRIYAFIISRLTGVPVGDSASGMRLFRRELLARLNPLPTGLHFTPAMTARAASLGARIVEVPIPYAERQGQSKLNVVADGLRFLRVILGVIFAIHPLRVFGPMGALFALAALGYGIKPVRYYLAYRHLEEDMIYRLLTIVTLAVCGQIAVSFGLIAQQVSRAVTRRPGGWLDRSGLAEAAVAAGALLGLGGVFLNSRNILEYLYYGRITGHWVYVLAGALAVISGMVQACFGVTLALVRHLPSAQEDK